MCRIRGLAIGIGLSLTLAVPRQATAATITVPLMGDPSLWSFSGSFQNDNDVALFFFVLTEDSRFQASTTSAAAGGFDTLLTLFQADPLDNLTYQPGYENDDPPTGGPDAVLFDPLTGEANFLLTAGRYALALTQSANYFEPGRGGFSFDDSPMFTCPAVPAGEMSTCTGFIDFLGQSRTSAFAGSLTVTPLVPPEPVPEPATLVLMTTGLAGLVLRRQRRDRVSERRIVLHHRPTDRVILAPST
jgi:hypothetical protein